MASTSCLALLRNHRGLLRTFFRPGVQLHRTLVDKNDGGWWNSVFGHKVDARKDAHSNLLSKKATSGLYKIQFHNVKPKCLEAYNELSTEVQKQLHKDPDYPCEIVGSWNTWYGEQDQAVHLWRYYGGYPALMECLSKLRENKMYLEFRKERSKMLISRQNQLLLEFSFWNDPVPRPGPNIYELRTYRLKPGTMIEWGNHWARAIKYRQENNEAVGGFFTQIGELYVVHHLWAYKDLQSREETRNAGVAERGLGCQRILHSTPNPENGVKDLDPHMRFTSAVTQKPAVCLNDDPVDSHLL